MTSFLWLEQRASAPSPSEIAAYLKSRGWTVSSATSTWALARKRDGKRDLELEIPQHTQGGGYPRAVHLLLEDIARVEQRPASTLLTDIRAATTDIVRLAIESPFTRDGRITVEAGHRVYEAARDLLLAAACSVDNPRPAFPHRKAVEAMDLIRRARFGQTEIGSFVLTIECEVAQRLRGDGEASEDADEPLERQTSARLAEAMAGLGDATREAANSASIEPFRNRVPQGVSANLCEAIAEILDAASADSLCASFSFANHRPLRRAAPRDVYFTAEAIGQLREAACELREEATYPGFEVSGHVVRLDSLDPAIGGKAIVHSEVDKGWRHVVVDLLGKAYTTAIEAHKAGTIVRCVGNLRKSGRAWVLEDPRGFESAPER